MKSFTRKIFTCEMCDREYDNEHDALICEQFCMLIDSTSTEIFSQKTEDMDITKKESILKDFAKLFKKMWIDGDSEHGKFYLDSTK